MFLDLIYTLLGTFFAVFIIYNFVIILFNFIVRYKISAVKVAIYSFVISIIVIAFIPQILNNQNNSFYYYLMLVVNFFIEYRRQMYKKCPYCAERIRSNAIVCKHCHSSLSNNKKEIVN